MTACSPAERLARAALSRVGEPDDARLRRLVDTEGVVGAWDALRRGDRLGPIDSWAGLLARAAETEPQRDLARIDALGGRVVCPGESEWPTSLDALNHLAAPAPFALWVRGSGNLAELARRGVSVVGSRAATAYGMRVAGDLSAELASGGWCIVSGGAYGVDSAAHRGALVMEGSTVVVLACGVDVAYPRAHAEMFSRVRAGGLLVSEAPPGASALRHRFLIRNRLIAALGLGTVVVEAAVRSGALSTAGHAERLSKPVMAVPGSIGSALSTGCHLLIRERNAMLVTTAGEVLEVLSPAGQGTLDVARESPRPGDELPADLRRLLDAVPVRTPAATVRIAVQAGFDPRTATGRLAELAAQGFVERTGPGWRLAAEYRRTIGPAAGA